MYDIFYVSKNVSNKDDWIKIKSKYPTAQKINNVKDYNQIISRAFTKMFWVIWDDVDLIDSFNLIEYRATEWDNMYVHVFKNGEHFDGICLFPKNLKVSQREFEYRFFTNKKEIDICASYPVQHDRFNISSYKEYLDAIGESKTEMFWCIWNNVKINDDFNFNFQVPYYDNHIPHIFKNGEHFDGICLFPTKVKVTPREFEYRFFTNKKEIDICASYPILEQYDIVFISYNEPNADNNYQRLLTRFPQAKRVNGVKGIHQAHIKAAELCSTEYFWVVDGDSILVDDFNFEHHVLSREKNYVYVYKSKNPINNLEYGYGGVKLLPRENTLRMDTDTVDMTTSISKNFKAIHKVSNITAFNTDPFNTWKSAFRECVKLSSRVIDRQQEKETQDRLNIWCSIGEDKPFGDYAINGAIAGKKYGLSNKDKPTEIKKINDFQWLKKYYEQRTKNIHT